MKEGKVLLKTGALKIYYTISLESIESVVDIIGIKLHTF